MKYLLSALFLFFAFHHIHAQEVPQTRLIVLTDMTHPNWEEVGRGAEPDDYQSLIRLMYYANEFNIEGLITSSSCWLIYNEVDRSSQKGLMEEVIDNYGKIRDNLLLHGKGYPTVGALKAVLKIGNDNGMPAVGEGKSTEGSNLILQALQKEDSRPLWVNIWGGAAPLAQALWDLKQQGNEAERKKWLAKLRVYDIGGQDNAGAWIAKNFPEVMYLRSQRQFEGISPRYDQPEAAANQARRGGDEACVQAQWIADHIQHNHGVLASTYPNPRYALENDTPAFLYLMNNGLSDPEFPYYGSWGGRFTREKVKNPDAVFTDIDAVAELVSGKPYLDYFMYAEAKDRWQYQGLSYHNVVAPIFRWRRDFQNDFAARLDWGISDRFDEANHAPNLVIDGYSGLGVREVQVEAGTTLYLDASASSDPDGDALYFQWWIYHEPSISAEFIQLKQVHHHTVQLEIAEDFPVQSEVHVILTVQDEGEPRLTRYRRVILKGRRN